MTARKRRSGFTLFEVILVASILLILAALAYPSLRTMYPYYKLQGGVDAVRTSWAHARARAIEEGRPYRFAVESQGSHFRIAPDRPEYWSGGAGPEDDPDGRGFVLEQSLPAGVRFTVGDSPGAPPEETEATQNSTPPSGDWTPVAVFLPDGTAREDVRMVFQVQGTFPMVLSLRGLTGSASVQTLKP